MKNVTSVVNTRFTETLYLYIFSQLSSFLIYEIHILALKNIPLFSITQNIKKLKVDTRELMSSPYQLTLSIWEQDFNNFIVIMKLYRQYCLEPYCLEHTSTVWNRVPNESGIRIRSQNRVPVFDQNRENLQFRFLWIGYLVPYEEKKGERPISSYVNKKCQQSISFAFEVHRFSISIPVI